MVSQHLRWLVKLYNTQLVFRPAERCTCTWSLTTTLPFISTRKTVFSACGGCGISTTSMAAITTPISIFILWTGVVLLGLHCKALPTITHASQCLVEQFGTFMIFGVMQWIEFSLYEKLPKACHLIDTSCGSLSSQGNADFRWSLCEVFLLVTGFKDFLEERKCERIEMAKWRWRLWVFSSVPSLSSKCTRYMLCVTCVGIISGVCRTFHSATALGQDSPGSVFMSVIQSREPVWWNSYWLRIWTFDPSSGRAPVICGQRKWHADDSKTQLTQLSSLAKWCIELALADQ